MANVCNNLLTMWHKTKRGHISATSFNSCFYLSLNVLIARCEAHLLDIALYVLLIAHGTDK